MAGTRSSTKSSPKKGDSAAASTKRKADDATSPDSKREHKAPKQMTIEESMDSGKGKDATDDSEMKKALKKEDVRELANEDQEQDDGIDDNVTAETVDSDEASMVKEGGAVKESSGREDKMASNILEKGII
jgi:hypothetical protein